MRPLGYGWLDVVVALWFLGFLAPTSAIQAVLCPDLDTMESTSRPLQLDAGAAANAAVAHAFGNAGASLGPCCLQERFFQEIDPGRRWLSIYHVGVQPRVEPTLKGFTLRVLWDENGPQEARFSDRRLQYVCSNRRPDLDSLNRIPPVDTCKPGTPCRSRLYWRYDLQRDALELQYLLTETDPLENPVALRDPHPAHRSPVRTRWQDQLPLSSSLQAASLLAPSIPSSLGLTEVPPAGENIKAGTGCSWGTGFDGSWRSVWAPEFVVKENRGSWTLKPLAGAVVEHGQYWQRTNDQGFFCRPDGIDLTVKLITERLEIRGLERPEVPLEIEIEKDKHPEHPMVLQSLDDLWKEQDVASALFRFLNATLDQFDEILPLPRPSSPLLVHQTAATSGTTCHASIQGRRLEFPLICRKRPHFEPKGLCREIVAHEAAHDLMTRALELAENRPGLIPHSTLDDGLADFFAAVLTRSPTLGRFCSSDFRQLETAPSSSASHQGTVSNPVPRSQPRPGVSPQEYKARLGGRLWILPALEISSEESLKSQFDDPEHIAKLILTTLLWRGEESTDGLASFVDHFIGTVHDLGLEDGVRRAQDVFRQNPPLPCRVCGPEELGSFSGPLLATRKGRTVHLKAVYGQSYGCPSAEWSEDGRSWKPLDTEALEPGGAETLTLTSQQSTDRIYLRAGCHDDFFSSAWDQADLRGLQQPVPVHTVPLVDRSQVSLLPQDADFAPGQAVQRVLVSNGNGNRSGLAWLSPQGRVTIQRLEETGDSGPRLEIIRDLFDSQESVRYRSLLPGRHTLRGVTANGDVEFVSLVEGKKENFNLKDLYHLDLDSWVVQISDAANPSYRGFKEYRDVGGRFSDQDYDLSSGTLDMDSWLDLQQPHSDPSHWLDDFQKRWHEDLVPRLPEKGLPEIRRIERQLDHLSQKLESRSSGPATRSQPAPAWGAHGVQDGAPVISSSDTPSPDQDEVPLELLLRSDGAVTWASPSGQAIFLTAPQSTCSDNLESIVVGPEGYEHVIVATCDGWIHGLDRQATGPWDRQLLGQSLDVSSNLLQEINSDGSGEAAVIAGPYISHEFDDPFLELLILRADGSAPNGLDRLRVEPLALTQVLPADLDGDGCDEVVLVGDEIRLWDPNTDVAGCR